MKIKNNEYFYIVEERGIELEYRRIDNIDILLYWIISDIVFFWKINMSLRIGWIILIIEG
ncbi:Imm63 family immunity protein [Acinetobacter soli]|uniref:Imm63 family immunity protein n=1 Tax=Acinetobacter soli TaxID=487316 RepID=UPI00125D73F1